MRHGKCFPCPKGPVNPGFGADPGAGGASRACAEDFLAPLKQDKFAGDGFAGQRVASKQTCSHIRIGANDQRLERHNGDGIVRP